MTRLRPVNKSTFVAVNRRLHSMGSESAQKEGVKSGDAAEERKKELGGSQENRKKRGGERRGHWPGAGATSSELPNSLT
jgi:hypothetical protein